MKNEIQTIAYRKILAIIFVCLISTSAIAQDITNTLAPGGKLIVKDAANNYLVVDQTTGQVNILKTLRLENTSSPSLGVIFMGIDRFIHNYGTDNTFIGINTGNFAMTGSLNTAVGKNSLNVNTTGSDNTALGTGSLQSNTTGSENSAFGRASLYSNTTGNSNSAFGSTSLYYNTTGNSNSAFGYETLLLNTTGFSNSAFGSWSLCFNTTGSKNSAFGYHSLYSNTEGYENSAFGYQSLLSNTTGSGNSTFGRATLYSNTTGYFNSAFGVSSLQYNTEGYYNSAFGNSSLLSNTTGYNNSAFGVSSLSFNTTGFYNTALGYGAGSNITSGNNLTCLGFSAQPTSGTATNQITLGNYQITSLRCNVTTITSLSDARDKKNIKDLDLGIDFLMKIKPRQFNWDRREWYEDNISDGSKMKEEPTAGFIAQELDEAQTEANAEWLNLVLKDNPEKWEATPGNLLPIMVKAIQDLKAEKDIEIAKLKSENNELKKEVASLKSMNEKLTTLEQLVNNLTSIKQTSFSVAK
jgi:trimeric autotransporter adhesin